MKAPFRALLFDLCWQLGVEHPDRLELNSRQVSEWLAWLRLRAMGAENEDIRWAMLTAQMANTMRGKGQPSKTVASCRLSKLRLQTTDELLDELRRAEQWQLLK